MPYRTRGYLPHHDHLGAVQHVVLRLADSLPRETLRAIFKERAPDRLRLAEASLDEGFGGRALAIPTIATVVQGALLHFDMRRYELLAWCVMPTHVHVLVRRFDAWSLGGLAHAWKSFTAHRANAIIGASGPFWAREYFDRCMRDDDQLQAAADYIEANPVAASLCAAPADWRWSSACRRRVNPALADREPAFPP